MERWAHRPRWMLDEVPDDECGAFNAVFWITVGALVGLVVGLVAWKLWGGE